MYCVLLFFFSCLLFELFVVYAPIGHRITTIFCATTPHCIRIMTTMRTQMRTMTMKRRRYTAVRRLPFVTGLIAIRTLILDYMYIYLNIALYNLKHIGIGIGTRMYYKYKYIIHANSHKTILLIVRSRKNANNCLSKTIIGALTRC